MAPQLTLIEKELIISLRLSGYRVIDICRRTGRTKKTIIFWLRRWKESGSLEGHHRQFYARATTEEDDAAMVAAHTADPFLSTKSTSTSYSISRDTVRRRLKEAGKTCCRSSKKILKNQALKEIREPDTTISSLRTGPNDAFSEGTPSTSNTQNSKETEIEMPKPIEVPAIKIEIDDPMESYVIEIVEHDIKQEITEEFSKEKSAMENPFSTFAIEEPNYHTNNISNDVILKSILTRKTPIKEDMTKDSLAPIYEINQGSQLNLNSPVMNLEPKIMNTTAATGTCLFCDKKERQIGSQTEFPSRSQEKIYEKVLSYAEGLNDYDLLGKLKDTKTFSFHPLCRTDYRNKYEKNCVDQDRLVFKNLHAEAFEGLCAFIDDKIIDKHKTYFLSDLYERYKALLYEIQNSSIPLDFEKANSLHSLQQKIVNKYCGIIDITTSKDHKRKIVYKSEIKTNFNSAVVENKDLKYDKLAFELRGVIKSMRRNNSDEAKSVNEIPEKLYRFIGSLIQGPDVRKMTSYEDCLKIKSMCEDIVDRIIKED